MSENITPRKRKAIETLLTCGDLSQAAAAANVSRTTVYRWLKQETFKLALTDAESEAIASLSRALVGLGERATKTLQAAMDDPLPTAAGARVRAADIVLARLLQLRELYSLESRIAALEAARNDPGK